MFPRLNFLGRAGLTVLIASVMLLASAGAKAADKLPMKRLDKSEFGKLPDGSTAHLYTLQNSKGMVVKVTDYGLIITEILVPDRNGKVGDVVLGFDNLPQYLKGHPFFGAIAGRYANRIAKAKFSLDGKEYTLAANNGKNHLHGGKVGFDKKLWAAEPLLSMPDRAAIAFKYTSKDGEEGYPGNLGLTVVYTLTDDNELIIDYSAATDKKTVINVTNHSYFNLAGAGDVLEHELQIEADQYTPVDAELIPTGEIAAVKGTPLDFTSPHKIGERIEQTGLGGYDHNFVLRGGVTERPRFAARAYEPKSGRVMEVSTTEPGVQLYTGIGLNGSLTGVGGVKYPKSGGFCLETQHYPDSPNKPSFPSVVLEPGKKFHSVTAFKFSTK
jgi:aldose 1-epimerase